MTNWVDVKYINLISNSLPLFKWVSEDVANFRCPYCGDSKKKYSKHGYFFEQNGIYFYKCHRCSESVTLSDFIKQHFNAYYAEYMLDKFATGRKSQKEPNLKKNYKTEDATTNIKKISQLGKLHPAYQYLINRKIPEKFFDILYYTDNFRKWVNENVIPDKFEETDGIDSRIVIPFFSGTGKPFAYQGRALDPNAQPRYQTIKNNDMLLVYGLERVDINKPIFLVEGPFDSLFLDNSLAAAGSSLGKMIDKDLDIIFVFDNEPRSPEIVALMHKVIKKGKKIVIWPKTVTSKDINDMVLKGIDVKEIIRQNTYSGLKAQLEFNRWKV